MEEKNSVSLYGASGHCRVIMDIIRGNGGDIRHVIDDNPNVLELEHVSVCHKVPDDCEPLIVSIGNCGIRKRIVEKLSRIRFATAISKHSIISPSVNIGEGSVVMAGAVIETAARIGRHCIINTGACINHECKIGDFVHIAPNATVCGDVNIGEGSWIGAGATVVQCLKIGKNCMIAAGAVVIKDVPDNAVVAGVPAKIIKFNDPVTAP